MSTSDCAALSVIAVHRLIEPATFSPVSGSSPSTMIPHGDGVCGFSMFWTMLYRMSPVRTTSPGLPQAGWSSAVTRLWPRGITGGRAALGGDGGGGGGGGVLAGGPLKLGLAAAGVQHARDAHRLVVVLLLPLPHREHLIAGGAAAGLAALDQARRLHRCLHRQVPLQGCEVGGLEQRGVTGDVPGDGARLALAIGQRALLREDVAVRAGAGGGALVGGAAGVACAVGTRAGMARGVLGGGLVGAGDRLVPVVEVALLPDVVAGDEAAPLLVQEAIVAGVAAPVVEVEGADGFEAHAVEVHRFIVGVGHAPVRLANGQLRGVAVAVRIAAARDLADGEKAGGDAAVHAERRQVQRFRGGVGLVGDVEIDRTAGVLIDDEARGVRALRVQDGIGERLVLHRPVDADLRQRVVVVGGGDQGLRPVDAERRSVVPG